MTRGQIMALVAPLCRLTADPDVRGAIDALRADPSGPLEPLQHALHAHREGNVWASIAPQGDAALDLLVLCRQCSAAELIGALSTCPDDVTLEALSVLVGQRRQQEARALYGLQLLWRLLGDGSIPDALSVFGQEAAAHQGEEIRCSLIRQLRKEATAHDDA